MVEYRTPTEDDIQALAAGMRAADRLEVSLCGHEPEEGVRRSIASSTHAWAARIGGELICILGVAPVSMLGGVGSPWLLGTDLVARWPAAFMRQARDGVQEMLRLYPHLINFVHVDNALAIAWLRRAGFRLHAPILYGPRRAPFHPFEIHRQ